MSFVDLTIFGKPYTVGCDTGKEQHLRELGCFIDRRLKTIAASAPTVTETTLMMHLCLMLADELNDATREVFQLKNQLEEMQRDMQSQIDKAVAEAYDEVSARLAAVTSQLEQA